VPARNRGGWRRAGRWLGFDRNPLRRASDRLESLLKLVTVAAVAASVVLAVQLGEASYHDGHRSAAAHHARYQQVPAVLQVDAPAAAPGPAPRMARASWIGPGGHTHTAPIPVDSGAKAGHQITISTDAHGDVVSPPPTGDDIVLSAAATGIGVLLGTFAVTAVAAGGAWHALNAARTRRLGLEWQEVATRWDLPR
jgi:hypothetical protein